MISVIICSVNQSLLAAVKQNINETIGVAFEIIAIDNRNSTAGICEVYNRGAVQAKYEVLCFMHEDVIMQTQNWGSAVLKLLQSSTGIGLIGVAGSYFKTISPSGWGNDTGYTDCMNIIQGFKNKGSEFNKPEIKNPFGKEYIEVAALDGVWLCTTKDIALQFKFDQQNFPGFHGYDVDFSLTVGQHYKVVVTYEVLLTHLSEGSYTRTWMMETIKLHQKWKKHLPVITAPLTNEKRIYLEKYTFRAFVRRLIALNLPLSLVKDILWQKVYVQKLGIGLWINLNFHLYKFWKKLPENPDYHPEIYLPGE